MAYHDMFNNLFMALRFCQKRKVIVFFVSAKGKNQKNMLIC